MTNWGFDDSQTNDQGNNDNTPGGLRSFAEAQKTENKALKDQLAAIQKRLDDQLVQSVFTDLGVPGAAGMYQGDADPVKAKAWVDDMQKLFGGNTQGTPSSTPVVDTPPTDSLPPLLQQQMDQFNSAGASGSPLGSVEQAQANVNDANDLQGLINAMNFGR